MNKNQIIKNYHPQIEMYSIEKLLLPIVRQSHFNKYIPIVELCTKCKPFLMLAYCCLWEKKKPACQAIQIFKNISQLMTQPYTPVSHSTLKKKIRLANKLASGPAGILKIMDSFAKVNLTNKPQCQQRVFGNMSNQTQL